MPKLLPASRTRGAREKTAGTCFFFGHLKLAQVAINSESWAAASKGKRIALGPNHPPKRLNHPSVTVAAQSDGQSTTLKEKKGQGFACKHGSGRNDGMHWAAWICLSLSLRGMN